jgi:hypothetical protein
MTHAFAAHLGRSAKYAVEFIPKERVPMSATTPAEREALNQLLMQPGHA